MTCNPLLQTCLPSAVLEPTGFCGPNGLGPTCYSDPLQPDGGDLFSQFPAAGIGSPPLGNPLFHNYGQWTGGACFNDELAADPLTSPIPSINEALSHFEPGREYRLSETIGLLPPELAPYALALQTNPLAAFRITSVVTPEGVTVPQFAFYEASNPSSPSGVGGSGPRSGSPTAPGGPSSVGVTLGFAGAVGGVLLLDRALIRPLIANGTLPHELHAPALFTSASVATLALERAGVLPRGSLAAGFNHMGGIMGFQAIATVMLHELGGERFRAGTFGNQAGSMILAMLPYAYARLSPAAAEILGLRAAAAGAEAGTVAAEIGLGARALTWGARGIGAVGVALLMDPAAGAMEWAIEHAIGASDNRIYRLQDMARDVDVRENNAERLGERGGFWMTAFLGNLVKTGYGVRAELDSGFETYYNNHIDGIAQRYIDQSKGFENFMEFNLLRIVQENTTVATDGTSTTDWTAVSSGISRLYTTEGLDGEGNAVPTGESFVRGHYGQLENFTGDYANDADALRGLIAADGTINDLEGLQRHLRNRLAGEFYRGTREMNARALELGLATRRADGAVVMNPIDADHVTDDQRAYLEGDGLRMSLRLMYLHQQLQIFPRPS